MYKNETLRLVLCINETLRLVYVYNCNTKISVSFGNTRSTKVSLRKE